MVIAESSKRERHQKNMQRRVGKRDGKRQSCLKFEEKPNKRVGKMTECTEKSCRSEQKNNSEYLCVGQYLKNDFNLETGILKTKVSLLSSFEKIV